MPMSKNTSNNDPVDPFSALFGSPVPKQPDDPTSDSRSGSSVDENSSASNGSTGPTGPTQDVTDPPKASVFSSASTESTMSEEDTVQDPDGFGEESIKEPQQPFLGYLWDKLPEFIRKRLLEFGYNPPASALKTSPINVHTGSKGGLLIGPPKAGKTTLIAALHRACITPSDSEIELRWKGGIDSASQKELSRRLTEALNQILSGSKSSVSGREGTEATWQVTKYTFNIEGRLRHPHHFNSLKLFDLTLSFHDGPGGAMFSDTENAWESQASNRNIMVKDSRDAYTLLFCLDGSQKQAYSMQSNLSRILPLLQDHKKNDGYIPPKRVIILLNKVDQIATSLYEELGKGQPSHRVPITPRQIAEEMDPLQMAIECLGYASLKMIRDSMSADAQLAVGLVSNWGFKDSGFPLVDKSGVPVFLSEINRGDENDFVAQWQPFGIRETLIYIATGRVDSTIKVIGPNDLNQKNLKAYPVDL